MRLPSFLICSLLASAIAAAASADPALVSAFGKVEIGRGTPPVWRVARSGDALAPGDSVRTSVGARAELQLGDNRIVRVYERSVLRVGTSVTPTGAVRSVDLDQGQSIFDVMKKTVADEFDVVTPEVVVSVKGTRFLVAAVEGADYTSVFRGVVGLAGAGFDAISVRPGMSGAHGELFLTPYADPWEAWEKDATAPAPAIDGGREHEVGSALQAVIGGSEDGGSKGGDSGASQGSGLVGGLLGSRDASGTASAGASGGSGSSGNAGVLAPVSDVTGALAPTLADPGGSGSLLSPVLTPIGGPPGANRSP